MQDRISVPWVLGALAIYMLAEALLGGLFGQLLGGFVSRPFRLRLEVLLMLTSWWAGGFVVGLVSPRVRLVEPAIGAALVVAITSMYALFMPISWFTFTWTKVLWGGAIAFGLALWGADTGERAAARMGNRASRDYTDG